MLAFELSSASKALYSIIGSVENDDVLERIFSNFVLVNRFNHLINEA